MTLNELMSKAASGYPDAQILLYWDFADEEPRANPNGGDTLAHFIAVELAETFDPDASEPDQAAQAVRSMERAERDLRGVIDALQNAEQGGIGRTDGGRK